MAQLYPEPPFERHGALFLDVDGTLIDFAQTPSSVCLTDGLLNTVATLHNSIGGALALISGRPITELDALFAPLELACAGLHGCERRDSTGTIHRHGLSAAARLASEISALHDFATLYPGVIIEDKGISVAVHYRLAPAAESAAHDLVAMLKQDLGDGFIVQEGSMVIEIKPSGRDKGVAIEEYLKEQPFHDRTAVFVGDDLTDEFGFNMVNAHEGHSIKVGNGETAAHWRLADPAAVRLWLERYATFLTD